MNILEEIEKAGDHLDLSRVKLNNQKMAELVEALKVNKTIGWLDIHGVYIRDEAFEELKASNALKRADFGANNIKDEGVIALAEALRVNNTIRWLDLSCNKNIGDKGAEALAEMLKVNKGLKRFDLSFNNITDKGAVALFEALKVNEVVRINLAFNCISAKMKAVILLADIKIEF